MGTRVKGRLKTHRSNTNAVSIIRRYQSERAISKIFSSNKDVTIFDGRVEMDTHADTFVAGRNCLLMHYTERVCDVSPYSEEYKAKTNVPIVQVATGYTSADGKRYILIINEALWFPDLPNSLANPNQFRHFGVHVQDNPFDEDPMVIRQEYDDISFVACLKSEGTDIFIETWTPSLNDLNNLPHVVLTSPDNWNPSEVKLPGISELERKDIEEGDYRGVSTVNVENNWENYMDSTDTYLQPV
mmetsp:Transcript_16579/g.25067  ORF Transcript_16579/g.25067 Transcript_16579/m.25067 type:complete len:243 (-) Transcript_16579:3911-4639(-)